MKTRKKVLIGIGVVLSAIVLFGLWIFVGQKIYIRWQQQRFIASLEKIKDQYRNDQYGGATPEETLQLFIKAFKAGDLELASKYFVIEKQGEVMSTMNEIVKNDRKDVILKTLLSYDKKECYKYNNTCELSKYDGNLNAYSITKFRLNTYTNKWKIDQL